jgi:dUTP pyrophosphatase
MNKSIKYSKEKDSKKLERKHYFDAGTDLCSTTTVTIKAGSSALITTGIKMEIPDGHVGLIWSKSGLSVKNNIEIGAGCIDSTFRGEIIVHAYNMGSSDFIVEIGNKIAQILIIPIVLPEFVEDDNLSETARGADKYGSTGV